MKIDAFGKQCPMPLVMVKKELDAGCKDLSIAVDNETSVKNLSRLGKRAGMTVDVQTIDGGYLVRFSEGAGTEGVDTGMVEDTGTGLVSTSGYSIFIGKDHVGEGDFEIGYNLIKMAIYTLSELEDVPVNILFMNSGVRLPTGEEEQIIDNLKTLADKGSEILVCGACLDYYGLKEKLKVGEISNMYDILERMREVSKVISL